jgi:16S rRNA (guanine527-N7)-methyltransferase
VSFVEELAGVLPQDLPHRDSVIQKAARHLEMIEEANRAFNLTRITTPREAAVKHVLDSILPWRLFENAEHILDAGTGAGFPGIPLATLLKDCRFTLSESIGKKSRFVEAVVEELKLVNVRVEGRRAEDILRSNRIDIITARAVAPISRAIELFANAFSQGSKALLYKGPDVQLEIDEAGAEIRRRRLRVRIVARYDLPDALGSRTIVEISR